MKISRKQNEFIQAVRSGKFDEMALGGGTGCFRGDTLVQTIKGKIPISLIKKGDFVASLCVESQEILIKKVTETFKHKNTKKTICVKLKNGHEIVATEDHQFWYKGEWLSLKHVLELWHERTMENNTKFQ
jgi:hypothetical protein